MKFVLLLIATLFGCALSAKRTFSVRVKGAFLCHEKPYANLPIDIYHQTSTMKYPNFMDRFANAEGAFDLSAYLETDDYMIQPYIILRHSCWLHPDVPQRCQRKVVWRIPTNLITSDKEPAADRVYDLGSVELAFKNPNEVIVKCGM